MISRAFCIAQAVALSACSTLVTVTQGPIGNEGTCRHDPFIPRIYSGTFNNIGLWDHIPQGEALFLATDLPFSVIADTCVLPYTVITQIMWGSICPVPKEAPEQEGGLHQGTPVTSLASEATLPEAMSLAGVTITFQETQGAKPVRELAFALTDLPAEACISGDWRKARALKDSENYTKDPAYKVENGRLEVLLVNGICDAYDSYIGQFAGGIFNGEHVLYGWQHTVIGQVSGVWVR